MDNLERGLGNTSTNIRKIREEISSLGVKELFEGLRIDLNQLRSSFSKRYSKSEKQLLAVVSAIEEANSQTQSNKSKQDELFQTLQRIEESTQPMIEQLDDAIRQTADFRHIKSKTETIASNHEELFDRLKNVEESIQELTEQLKDVHRLTVDVHEIREGLKKRGFDSDGAMIQSNRDTRQGFAQHVDPEEIVPWHHVSSSRPALEDSGVASVSSYLKERLINSGLRKHDAEYVTNVALMSCSIGLLCVFKGYFGEYVCNVVAESLLSTRYEVRVRVGETRSNFVDELMNTHSSTLELHIRDLNLSEPEVLFARVFDEARKALIGMSPPNIVCLASIGQGPLHLRLPRETIDYASVVDTDLFIFRSLNKSPVPVYSTGFQWINETINNESDLASFSELLEELDVPRDPLTKLIIKRGYSGFLNLCDEAKASDATLSALILPRLFVRDLTPEVIGDSLDLVFDQFPNQMPIATSILNKALD